MTTRRQTRLVLVPASVLLLGAALASLVQVVDAVPATAASDYDAAVLADGPVAYWASATGTVDATGHGHNASAVYGGTAANVRLPNGQWARTYDGAKQYLSIPNSAAFSVPTRRALTWEAWIRPSTLQFPTSPRGYVDFMGVCATYSPSCEWEARMYNAVNVQNRASRISAYVFNPGAGLGSAADWQPVAGTFQAERWIHVVGEYQTTSTPSACNAAYPGTIAIWVDGVKQSFAAHAPTGCMSQYSIVPRTGSSPLLIGTLAKDTFFAGAIGKVAIYPRLLSQTEIREHFTAMTGLVPSGTCADTCTLAVQPALTSTASSYPATTSAPATTSSTSSTSITTPLAVAASPSATVSPAPSPTSSPTSSGVTASTTVASSWSTGSCVDVTVSSTAPITGWTVSVPISGRATSVWGASWEQSGATLVLTNLSWSGTVSPGAPRTGIGFCASTS